MFPALKSGEFVYLNSGGSGPPPFSVIEASRRAEDLCYGPAYAEGSGLYARQRESLDEAREAAARLLGANPQDIALTQSTTHGINLAVHSMDWSESDEVVSTATEHPGCLVPLYHLGSRYGVKVKLLSPPVTAEKVARAITPRTRLVALSHVDWTTGAVWPLEEICAAARDRGVPTVVDGAQSVGNISVDAPATGADMYAFTGHKWLLGPEGMGGLYVRPGCKAYSTNLGYASLAGPFDYEGHYELREDARRFESSTTSPALAAGFARAAREAADRGEAGPEEIRRRAGLLASMLDEIPRGHLRTPTPPPSGLVSFEVEGLTAEEVNARLLERGFVLRFIPDPYPYVRASVHLFNTEEELERLAKAVSRL